MRREGWATVVATAFGVALTVTPNIQTVWLAAPTWIVTAVAAWRWYSHREPAAPLPKFNGTFFTRPPAKPTQGEKLAWLDVQIETAAVSFSRTGETCVSLQLSILNASTDLVGKLKFFIADSHLTEGKRRMTYVPAAQKYDVLRRSIPDAPGFPATLYPPVTTTPGRKNGSLWFFHPSRQTLPFTSLMIEETASGAMWSIPIDPGFSKAVAENPTQAIIWPGPGSSS